MQTLQTLRRLRLGTERVRRRYGAGLVLIEELINESYGFILFLVYDFCIYLCCGYARVSKQLAGGVYVCPKSEHHRGEGMSGGMEGDVLGDSTKFCPLLDLRIQVWGTYQLVEYQFPSSLRQPIDRFP